MQQEIDKFTMMVRDTLLSVIYRSGQKISADMDLNNIIKQLSQTRNRFNKKGTQPCIIKTLKLRET